ncbi:MAG: M20/M25/M40 family metallo-hydrolase [Promethearchaeota archaeon]
MRILRLIPTFFMVLILFFTIYKTNVLLSIVTDITANQGFDWIDQVNTARMLADIQILASDQFEGRYPATDGDKLTLNYLSDQLKGLNVSPLDDIDDFKQQFNISPWTMPIAPINFTIDGKTLVYGTDYVELTFTGNSSVITPTEIVFVGYGIHTSTFDDYLDIDVSGKIVLVCRGIPTNGVASEHGWLGVKAEVAYSKGALGMIAVSHPRSGTNKPIKATLTQSYFIPDMGSLCANRTVLEQNGLNISEWITRVDSEYSRTGFYHGSESRYTRIMATLEVNTVYRVIAESANILAKFQSADYGSSDRVLIISAHHDHIGKSPVGIIYNGADDDASGTAVVLEVARVLNNLYTSHNFRKTIVIAFWGAEEVGLIGVRHFISEPLCSLGQIDLVIQHDMVGIGPVNGALTVGGGSYFPDIMTEIHQAASEYGNIEDVVMADIGSDHLAFLENNIPGVCFFWNKRDDHPNVHTVHDTADLIEPDVLKKVALTTLGYLIEGQSLLGDDSESGIIDSFVVFMIIGFLTSVLIRKRKKKKEVRSIKHIFPD